MKKIILPTDFSDNAYNAVRYAAKLFKDIETTFYLLNTYTPAVYQSEYILHSPAQIGLGDIYQENSLENLQQVKEKIEDEFENPMHTYMLHSAFNILLDEVLETIENENADLVIMGTQGATGAKEILFGTHTVHVIKKATCPVMAIPSGFEYEPIREILFPTDYEVDFKKQQLQQLLDIAEINGGSIEVIHASTGYELTEDQMRNQKKLESIFSKVAHRSHDLPSQGVIEAINSFQLNKPVDLLAMVQNKHTFFERLFIEPIIKKIGFHVTIPFMVIPHR
ncbi:universal stress protein [Maribacter algicola]|uniref:Universal stress protein n=1 Tax=Meishania litoralis TaxID=3434685 RepID=A0ACC7LI83_9FLAO